MICCNIFKKEKPLSLFLSQFAISPEIELPICFSLWKKPAGQNVNIHKLVIFLQRRGETPRSCVWLSKNCGLCVCEFSQGGEKKPKKTKNKREGFDRLSFCLQLFVAL